jgi:hypothetical protein
MQEKTSHPSLLQNKSCIFLQDLFCNRIIAQQAANALKDASAFGMIPNHKNQLTILQAGHKFQMSMTNLFYKKQELNSL